MASRHLIYTPGDLVLVMAHSGEVRAYEVQSDGGLVEQDPAVATAQREGARFAASAGPGLPNC